MDFKFHFNAKGPTDILDDTLETLGALIDDKELSIRVDCRGFNSLKSKQAKIDWQIYKSILHFQVYHAVTNSLNNENIDLIISLNQNQEGQFFTTKVVYKAR